MVKKAAIPRGKRTTAVGGLGRTVFPVVPAPSAEIFSPHVFKNEKSMMSWAGFNNPRVVIDPKALMDMVYIADASGYNEAGWLGTVERDGDILTIKEIFLFEQEVSGSSTDLDVQHIAQVATELIQQGPEGLEKVNALKFWGHIHPSGSTSPSTQDQDTMQILRDGNEWFLRGIFSRNGRAEFWLFDYERGIISMDIPWQIGIEKSSERRGFIGNLVKKLVRSITFPTRTTPIITPNYMRRDHDELLEDLDVGGDQIGSGHFYSER